MADQFTGAKKDVASVARDIGTKLIYISTDYVFDGERGMYRESDEVSPINYLGESKLGGERFVQEVCPDSVMARTSVLCGWNPLRLNFVTWVADELRKGNCIKQLLTSTLSRHFRQHGSDDPEYLG